MPAWSTWAKIPFFFFSFNFLVFFGTLWCFPWFWAPLWLPLWSPILCNLSVIGNVMKFSFQRYKVSINQTCSSKVISLRKLDTSQTNFFFFSQHLKLIMVWPCVHDSSQTRSLLRWRYHFEEVTYFMKVGNCQTIATPNWSLKVFL